MTMPIMCYKVPDWSLRRCGRNDWSHLLHQDRLYFHGDASGYMQHQDRLYYHGDASGSMQLGWIWDFVYVHNDA